MSYTETQLTGGAFQDSEGNVIAGGTMQLVLNADNSISGIGNICSGITITLSLDSNGNVASSTSTPTASDQYIWATDIMQTANAFYTVSVYNSSGQLVWGPNNQQVTSGGAGGGTFNVGIWTPNSVFSWTPSQQSLQLEVNGTDNVIQSLLNLVAGSNITITDDGNGSVTITSTTSTAPGLGYLSSFRPIHGAMCNRGSAIGQISSGYEILGSPSTTDVAPTSSTPIGVNYACSGSDAVLSLCDSGAVGTTGISLGSLVWAGCTFIPAVTTNGRYWLAATNINGGTSGLSTNTPTTIPLVGFRYVVGTDTDWQCVTGNGSSLTVVSSGVAPDTSNPHVFQIVPSGSSVEFYIDGTLVATISTTLPSTSTGLNWGLHLDNGATSSACSFTFFSILYQVNA